MELTERKLPIGVVSGQGMFPLKQDDVLARGSKAGEMVHEATDVLLCGKVVDGHGMGRTRVTT